MSLAGYGVMNRSFIEIAEEALRLPQDEQLKLAGTILEKAEASGDVGVDAAWEEEIERRIRSIDSGLAKGRPFVDVPQRGRPAGVGGRPFQKADFLRNSRCPPRSVKSVISVVSAQASEQSDSRVSCRTEYHGLHGLHGLHGFLARLPPTWRWGKMGGARVRFWCIQTGKTQ
jgi:hypothetical protein